LVGYLFVAAATSLAAGGNSSSFGELAEATGAAPATGPQLKLPQWRHQSVAEPKPRSHQSVAERSPDAPNCFLAAGRCPNPPAATSRIGQFLWTPDAYRLLFDNIVDPSVVCKKNLDADLLVLVFVAAELYYFSPFLQAEIDLVLLIYSPKELVKPNM
jgi:hypothetical protein